MVPKVQLDSCAVRPGTCVRDRVTRQSALPQTAPRPSSYSHFPAKSGWLGVAAHDKDE